MINILNLLKRIITARDFQLTIILFITGVLLAAIATYPTVVEEIEKDRIDEGAEEIEVTFPRLGRKDHIMGRYEIIKNATLEIQREDEKTNATIIFLDEEKEELENKSFEEDNKTYDLTYIGGIDDLTYLRFEVEEGEITYDYNVAYVDEPYSLLTIPGAILMVISMIFLFRFFVNLPAKKMCKEEKEKFDERQDKVKDILDDKDR